MAGHVSSFLLICTGNICRSPMAEGFWRAGLAEQGGEYRVASAGIAALVGYPADPQAVIMMQDSGHDISGHRARQLTWQMARDYELILVMEKRQQQWIESRMPVLRGRVRQLGHWAGGEIIDPYRGAAPVFRQVRERIRQATDAWLARLV